MKKYFINLFLAGVLAFAAIGCGSGGGDTSGGAGGATVVSGVTSKGPILGGTVTVYALNPDGTKGEVLGTATTSSVDGTYTVDIGPYVGDVVVEVTGGTYRDEATGTVTTNGTLSAAVTGATSSVSVAVTPLTEIAVQLALTDAGTKPLSEKVNAANSLVGTMSGNINIINTMPVDVSDDVASGNGTTDQVTYGLMLATVSQMVADGTASDVADAVAMIKADLADDSQLQNVGANVSASFTNFIANANNKSGVTTMTQTKIDDAIGLITSTPVTTPDNLTDLLKAKAMVEDMRNTMLSIYNYQGVGVPGIVETPFANVSAEMNSKIGPMLSSGIENIGWMIGSINSNTPGTYKVWDWFGTNNVLTYTVVMNSATETTVTFTLKDPAETTVIISGQMNYLMNSFGDITSGSLNATLKGVGGDILADLSFTVSNDVDGVLTGASLTGTFTGMGLTLDFSKNGGLHATFARIPGLPPGVADVYPTSIGGSVIVTTETVRMEGSLSIPSIVWVEKEGLDYIPGYYDYYTGTWVYGTTVCRAGARPASVNFTGSFSEMIGGAPGGVNFSGTLDGNWTNAASFDGCAPTGAANYGIWNASFNGEVAAPQRPTINVLLTASDNGPDTEKFHVTYTKTNPDSSVVSLTGGGTHDNVGGLLTIGLTNQDGLNLNLVDNQRLLCSDPGRLNGTVTTTGGAKLADIYYQNCMPVIKYIDNYFESII